MPSKNEVVERFERKFARDASGCWVWTAGIGGGGYPAFWWEGRTGSAHRAAYKLYVGQIPDKLFVCHKCDNQLCVNPSHLFLGSASDNMKDRDAKGRQAKGNDFKRSKLSVAVVHEILKSDLSDSALARKFAVTKGAINHVRHGRTWRHVEEL